MIARVIDHFRRTPLVALFGGECPALPLDLLRIFVGVLSFFYFLALAREAADISGPEGLIDHALVQDVFWFTRLGLFHPGIGLGVLQAVYGFALLASLAVIIGWRPKLFAFVLFVIAVSAFRWNFLVVYVEDAIMNLMLFWLLLLPVGKTLTFTQARRNWRGAWLHWTQVRVPGTVVGCFLCNLALIYLVAGGWKWTSPMWRDGTALFAILKLPVSHAPDFWDLQHLPFLRLLDWGALAFEPLFPLVLLLRRGHPLKWLLLAAVTMFHLGIVATMRLPFANLACLGASVVIFREEIMAWLAPGGWRVPVRQGEPMSAGWPGRIAVAFIVLLSLAMLRYVPAGGAVEQKHYVSTERSIDPRGAGGLAAIHKPIYGVLWLVGIAQQYQLFDWIDVRNHRFRYEITQRDGAFVKRIDPGDLFPDTNRSVFLQGYLFDHCWIHIPPGRSAELKRALALRFAQRYCLRHDVRGTVAVAVTIERITAANPAVVQRGPEVLFTFSVQDGRVVLGQSPPDSPVPRLAGIATARSSF
jgi:hypothetical protein